MDYVEFMEKMIKREHASRVSDDELQASKGHVWFLPHFQVYHPKKPDQIRVVFDCSAVYEGDSLNKHLLQGPDWMNALIGVLSRFRKEEIAVSCDIEQMFHNFAVNPEHRDFLRFLWFKDGDINQPIVEYRMNVHLFGAVSSPGVANFGLMTTAREGSEEFGEQAREFVENEFYVDDGLKSFASPEEAITTIKNAQNMCASANLRLHKFASNSKTVLESIPKEDRAKDLKDFDLRHDALPIQRSLGTYWCIESDTFRFRLQLKDKPCTRRGMLSTVCSVYDPLGIVAPVILVGKQILQDLCRDNHGWDEPVPSEILSRWEKWRSDLHLLEQVKQPRCVKPTGFGKPTKVEIHSFSDASDVGIGQVSYLRLINSEGRINVSFLMGKSRVAPLKAMTTPRMELTAAVVSVNVTNMLSKELNYEEIEQLYHTDSTVVLGYINNEARRFHTYVGNRVQHIRDRSDPKQWRHVAGELNPADEASRGLTATELLQNRRWFRGPDFLWHETEQIRTLPVVQLDPDDHEVRKEVATTLAINQVGKREENVPKVLEVDRFEHFSSFNRLKRSIIRIQRVIERKRSNKQHNWRPQEGPPTVKELEQAERLILKSVQYKHFHIELECLEKLSENDDMFQDRKSAKKRNTTLKRTSCLHKLDPFLDKQGVLRVGGRLKNATTPYEVKHPTIVPKIDHVTILLIRHYHVAHKHQGYGITHNAIRQAGYWVINGRSAVSSVIHRCVTCRKLRGRSMEQKMADLPSERVNPSPPFAYTGMDVFGPFYIKEGRKELKRWGIIFTCLSSRAVHLETLNFMNTDSFLNALRRFVSRRGKVRELRSDQGTNFIGGRNELAAALKELDDDAIKGFLSNKGCDWIKFTTNVPYASHMGGVWERLIRTVRAVLNALLVNHGTQLDDESLRTLLTEAESVVNSRPLTVYNLTEPGTLEPITPNHLLTGKSEIVLQPPGNFTRPDLYTRKRWRRVQYLTNQFWRRWQKEYNSLVQCKRQKWTRERRNTRIGDIVMVRDDDLARNNWKLGKVVEVFPGDDHLVRKVRVLVYDGTKPSHLDRPIQKLVLIVGQEDGEKENLDVADVDRV